MATVITNLLAHSEFLYGLVAGALLGAIALCALVLLSHPFTRWLDARDAARLCGPRGREVDLGSMPYPTPTEWLDSLRWDGTPRLSRMFIDLFGAEDTPHNRTAALCFAGSAVAVATHVQSTLQPRQVTADLGAPVNFMLALQGPQGCGKSSALRTLIGSDWYTASCEAPGSGSFYQCAAGMWAVELEELESYSKADVIALKALITSRSVTIRRPYERAPVNTPRRFVFVSTSGGDTDFIHDAVGDRRWMVVRAGQKIDVAAIAAQRDQLWAEAVHLVRAGLRWWELPLPLPAAGTRDAAHHAGEAEPVVVVEGPRIAAALRASGRRVVVAQKPGGEAAHRRREDERQQRYTARDQERFAQHIAEAREAAGKIDACAASLTTHEAR